MQPPTPATLPRWLLQETLANNGRYLSHLSREHVPPLGAEPLWLLDLPAERVQCFGDLRPLEALGLLTENRASLPLLDISAQTLAEARRVGWCFPTSSVRTVIPEAGVGMDGWALKLHVPDSLRARFSRRMASKEIIAADAAMAPVFSALLQRVAVDASPFLGVVEEPCSMVATIGSGEVGAIFRRLPDADLVPGFSLYSRPRSPLEGSAPAGVEMVRATSVSTRREIMDRCLALFVEPLLDIFFSLASRGVTLQMHAQNILFEMEPDFRATRRVWVRDMGGLTYAPEFRVARGQRDILPSVLEEVPGASASLVTRWLERGGQRRRLFDERQRLLVSAPGRFLAGGTLALPRARGDATGHSTAGGSSSRPLRLRPGAVAAPFPCAPGLGARCGAGHRASPPISSPVIGLRRTGCC